MFFQIILRRSLSLVENCRRTAAFIKTELFHRDLQKIYFDIKGSLFRKKLFVAPSETIEFKHMYQIHKRDSVSFVFERL